MQIVLMSEVPRLNVDELSELVGGQWQDRHGRGCSNASTTAAPWSIAISLGCKEYDNADKDHGGTEADM